MTARSVSVVGASGRVGSGLVEYLGGTLAVDPVVRLPGEALDAFAGRACSGGDVIVNAAGVAHIERETPAEVERLQDGNVDLPVALASAALERSRPLIHISSVKAVADAATAYGTSKYQGDRELERRFGPDFAAAGLQLVVVRPLALLFPPFDAGKMSRLAGLRWIPRVLTPAVRVPALAPSTFLDAVGELVARTCDGSAPAGFQVRDFVRSERATLRDVRDALVAASERGDRA